MHACVALAHPWEEERLRHNQETLFSLLPSQLQGNAAVVRICLLITKCAFSALVNFDSACIFELHEAGVKAPAGTVCGTGGPPSHPNYRCLLS
jgi:hypothetical protein